MYALVLLDDRIRQGKYSFQKNHYKTTVQFKQISQLYERRKSSDCKIDFKFKCVGEIYNTLLMEYMDFGTNNQGKNIFNELLGISYGNDELFPQIQLEVQPLSDSDLVFKSDENVSIKENQRITQREVEQIQSEQSQHQETSKILINIFSAQEIFSGNMEMENSLSRAQTDISKQKSKKSYKSSLRRQEKLKNLIFQQKNIKGITKKIQLSKLLVRMFKKYNKDFSLQQPLLTYNRNFSQILNYSKKNNFSMTDIADICAINLESFPEINQLNRKLLWQILKTYKQMEIIFSKSSQMDRTSYLIGTKVFELRCRSKKLAQKASYR